MYQSRLGFSLLPPRSVRQAFSNVFGASVSAAERAATQRLQAIAPDDTSSPAQQFVNQVPGGLGALGVIAAVGLGLLLLPKLLRR